MQVMRRLVLVLAVAALLVAAAFGVGHALRSGSSDRPTASGTGGSTCARPSPPRRADTTPTATARATPARGRHRRGHRATPTPTLEPGPRLLGPGDEGDEVRDLQARLKQIYWFQADITGTYGDVTTAAVRGFQASARSRSPACVDQRTLDRLAAMTTEPTEAEFHNRANQPGALDAAVPDRRVICVDKTSQTLRWVVDGQVLQTLDVRFGASTTPTREGVFHVYLRTPTTSRASTARRCRCRCSSRAVRPCTTPRTSPPSGTPGVTRLRQRPDYDGLQRLFGQVRVGDTVVVYWS